jgi:hypothetical protein
MIRANLSKSATLCPYCREEVQGTIRRIRCAQCGTTHHEICWQENDSRCAIFQCAGTQTLSAMNLTTTRQSSHWICWFLQLLPAILLLFFFRGSVVGLPFVPFILLLPLIFKRTGYSPFGR